MVSKLVSLNSFKRAQRVEERAGAPISGQPASLPGRDTTALSDLRVGGWLVQPALNRVCRDGQTVQVEPRLVHLLVCLASRPRQVISRNELLDTVWEGVVVGEETLTVAVSQLRRVLQDDARSPRYLETIRKTGYRLVAPVSWLNETVRETAPALSSPDPEWVPRRPAVRTRMVVTAGVLAAVAVVAAGVLSTRARPSPLGSPRPAFLEGVPFTSYPGRETFPAISPDGTRVAFVWNGGEGTNADIYVKQRESDTPLRLTADPQRDSFPTWSPDGATVAFVRFGEPTVILAVPAIGGPERRLAEVEPVVYGLDWSPDGASIALSSASDPERPYLIALLDLETSEIRPVTHPKAQFTCDSLPAFSPDGRTVAFVRAGLGLDRDVYLVPADGGGPERRLTSFQHFVRGLDWAADGRSVIFAAAPAGNLALWRVDVADGSVAWLPTRGDAAVNPSVAVGGSSLVYEQLSGDWDIWSMDLTGPATEPPPPEPLVVSTQLDHGAAFSPHGDQIAFISARSGTREIWVCRRDSTAPRRLTDLGGAFVVGLSWSPDGREIAFTACPDGFARVLVVEVASGRVRRLGSGPAHERVSAWSRDGEHLVASRQVEGRWQIWRLQSHSGEGRLLTANGVDALCETPDGRRLLYYRLQEPSLWSLDLDTGEERRLVGPEVAGRWSEVVATSDCSLVATEAVAGKTLLTLVDPVNGTALPLGAIPGPPISGLAVAPDRSQVLFDRHQRDESDLILVDRFR